MAYHCIRHIPIRPCPPCRCHCNSRPRSRRSNRSPFGLPAFECKAINCQLNMKFWSLMCYTSNLNATTSLQLKTELLNPCKKVSDLLWNRLFSLHQCCMKSNRHSSLTFLLSFPPSWASPTAEDEINKRTQIRGDIVAHPLYIVMATHTGQLAASHVHCSSMVFFPFQGCQMAKFDPFLSLDCARVEGVGAQSKERNGSNFAA